MKIQCANRFEILRLGSMPNEWIDRLGIRFRSRPDFEVPVFDANFNGHEILILGENQTWFTVDIDDVMLVTFRVKQPGMSARQAVKGLKNDALKIERLFKASTAMSGERV